MLDLSSKQSQALALRATTDFYFFCRWMFINRKGFQWMRSPHHKVICDELMKVFNGETKRLIINIPPRYGKTEIAVINFMAWALGKVPDSEFIHTSYSARLASNNSWQTRELVQHQAFLECFPNFKLKGDSQARDEWRTEEGGIVYAVGSGGAITGYGAGKHRNGFSGAIIIDDPHKADEARSEVMRQNVIEWFQNTLESRKNSPDTPNILIMQRLHEQDLAGWLIDNGNGEAWKLICLPAIKDDGTALWEAKHSIDELQRMEKSNPYNFAGQYMQRPSPLGGGIFRTDWWQYYSVLPQTKRIIQSWDTAFKAKEGNDYSVCTTWAECDKGFYLIDVFKQRAEFPELKRAAVNLYNTYKPHAVLVEDKASGQSLIQELKRETNMAIVPIKVDSDKVSRAYAITPLIESGRVYLPEKAYWLLDYIHSLATFPNAAHDDDVDSTTQALNYLTRGGGKTGLLDYYAEEVRKMNGGL